MDDDPDQLIRNAVRDEDQRVNEMVRDDYDVTEQIVQSFRGRHRCLTIFPMFLSLVYTGLLVWCVIEFFDSESTKHQIAWASGFLAAAMSVGLTKIWIWGEWRRQSMMREVKRLELRVGALCDRLSAP